MVRVPAILLAAGLALTAGRAGPRARAVAPTPQACAALRPADPLATTRAGFVQEVLDPAPTARTPRFHNPGRSYTVEAADLAAALAAESRACGRRLRGGVVLGPAGPLWEYQVLVFLGQPDGRTRVNLLRFPHGRVTYKGTAVVPAAAADSVLEALMMSPLLAPGPALAARDGRRYEPEGGYDVLAFRPEGDAVRARYGAFARPSVDTAAVRRLTERINALLAGSRRTYPPGPERQRGDA